MHLTTYGVVVLVMMFASPSYSQSDDDIYQESSDPQTALPKTNRDLDESAQNFFKAHRLGPVVRIGFPHPVSYGVELQNAPHYGGSIMFGAYKGKFETHQIKSVHWDLRLYAYPFDSELLAVLKLGHQTVQTDDAIDGDASLQSTGVRSTTNAYTITPLLGWQKIWKSGFKIGFELGYQFVLSPKTKYSLTGTTLGRDVDSLASNESFNAKWTKVKNFNDRYTRGPVPYVTCLQIGWLL